MNENVDNEIRDLVKNWRLEYQNSSHAKEKLDAEKAVDECKSALEQLEILRKHYREEKDKGEKLLTATKKKIKEVKLDNLASKREADEDLNSLRILFLETESNPEPHQRGQDSKVDTST